MSAPPRPLLVWDGDCEFCRKWVTRWRRVLQGRVDDATWQEAAPRFPHVPLERFRAAVQLVERDGRVYEGAEAVFRALATVPGRGWPLALYRRVPGFALLAEATYRFIARHRNAFARLTRWM